MKYNNELQQENTEHMQYKEFYLKQIVGQFDPGDNIELFVNGESVLSYTNQYNDCHFNMSVQDTGIINTDIDKLNAEISILQKRIAEEEAKELASK